MSCARTRSRSSGGIDGNERLTALSGAVLLVLLAAEGVTILSIRSMLSAHVFIGVLLIPFAIVAYIIAIAGLVTLGFLAVARLSGLPLVRSPELTPRGVSLRAMFIGLIGYLGLWLIAAALTSQPLAGGMIRIVALIVSWVAATAGLGATLLSRAGTQRPGRGGQARPAEDDLSWQTPTPVSGVTASRRK